MLSTTDMIMDASGKMSSLEDFVKDVSGSIDTVLTPDTEVDVEGSDPTTLEDYVESKIPVVVLTPDTEVDVEGEDPTTLEDYVESKIPVVLKYITSQTFTGNTSSGTLYTFTSHPTEILINFKMNGPGAVSGQLVMPIMIDYTEEVIYTNWSGANKEYIECVYNPSTKELKLATYGYNSDNDHYGIKLDVYAK